MPISPAELIANEDIEKALVRDYFSNKTTGCVVEVGANEPVSPYSQSWHLEEKLGWKAILIEPNPELAQKARDERPNATICEVACVREDHQSSMDLHIPLSPTGSKITGHAALGKNIDDHHYQEHFSVSVPTRSLGALLKDLNSPQIDVLSIDVEGTELDVLQGIDLNSFRPNLILLEDKHVYLTKHRFLKNHGYKLTKRTGLNCWYIPKNHPPVKQSWIEKIKLFKRMYLSIWLKKIKAILR